MSSPNVALNSPEEAIIVQSLKEDTDVAAVQSKYALSDVTLRRFLRVSCCSQFYGLLTLSLKHSSTEYFKTL